MGAAMNMLQDTFVRWQESSDAQIEIFMIVGALQE